MVIIKSDKSLKISETVYAFYEASVKRDMKKLYDYMNSNFKRRISFKYFLIHERYQQSLGSLIKISDISINEAKNSVYVYVTISKYGKTLEQGIELIFEDNEWKLLEDVFSDTL